MISLNSQTVNAFLSSLFGWIRFAAFEFLNFQLVPDLDIRVWHLIMIPLVVTLSIELFSYIFGFDL